MLEILLEFALEIGLELFFSLIGELFWDVSKSKRPRRAIHPVFSYLGYFIGGALLGMLSAALLPQRLFAEVGFRGASLVLTPLIAGTAMHYFGTYRRQHGKGTTRMATFAGGALFAFGVALMRFILVAR